MIGLAQRFGCAPHEVLEWPASALTLIAIAGLDFPFRYGRPEDVTPVAPARALQLNSITLRGAK